MRRLAGQQLLIGIAATCKQLQGLWGKSPLVAAAAGVAASAVTDNSTLVRAQQQPQRQLLQQHQPHQVAVVTTVYKQMLSEL